MQLSSIDAAVANFGELDACPSLSMRRPIIHVRRATTLGQSGAQTTSRGGHSSYPSLLTSRC